MGSDLGSTKNSQQSGISAKPRMRSEAARPFAQCACRTARCRSRCVSTTALWLAKSGICSQAARNVCSPSSSSSWIHRWSASRRASLSASERRPGWTPISRAPATRCGRARNICSATRAPSEYPTNTSCGSSPPRSSVSFGSCAASNVRIHRRSTSSAKVSAERSGVGPWPSSSGVSRFQFEGASLRTSCQDSPAPVNP